MTARIVKKLLKTTRNNKEKHKIVLLAARSKLNSIKSMISKALIENEISNEDFKTIINDERNYRELKESITMMKIQRSDIERNKLTEDGES